MDVGGKGKTPLEIALSCRCPYSETTVKEKDGKDKAMTKKASRSFDKTSKELLENPKVAAMYLEEILADRDMELFTAALKDVAEARVGSMTSLSKKTHLNRE
ncbi:transcriptional regulator [Candidatus Scalindua japonica]|uniref:Transcriptional regulator n=2 Tax=Candidatus Scalindua japonica TaxID=1284222 RepID=A0A286TT72_9BACT|nr:transcriptional regulator [Candidatus Scalindua japonica]